MVENKKLAIQMIETHELRDKVNRNNMLMR